MSADEAVTMRNRHRKKVSGNPRSRTPNQGAFIVPSNWLWAALLIVALIVVYQPVWHAGFIWDDDAHLTKNPCIIGPIGFKGIWTTAAATYYPLVLTSFWFQHALWGLNPLPYHLVNVAMHAGCAVLLWGVLRRLEVKGAWLGAALWAVHPVQVESAAWITELKNTQSCFFYLLSILFFLKWRDRSTPKSHSHSLRWYYFAALLCALAAISSKSSTVMLPVVLGLCWWWKDRRWTWRNAVPLIPFLCVAVVAAGWTIWEQKFHSKAIGLSWDQTWLQRIIIAGYDIWFYLGKLLWPHPLSFIYPQWQIDATQPLAYLPILAAISGLVALWWKRDGPLRPVFFAAVYFVGSLFPVLGFFNVYFFRYSFVGDHLQYLASMGPLALIGSALVLGFGFFAGQAVVIGRVLGMALLCLLGALSWKQAEIYRDPETLWFDTFAKNPHSWMVQNSISFILLRQGRIPEAWELLQRVSNPDNPVTQTNLGLALTLMGRPDEACIHLKKAIEVDPTCVPAYANLGSVLLKMGLAEESLVCLKKALQIDPNFVSAHLNIANTLLQTGRTEEAFHHLQRAFEIAPHDPEAQKNLAWIMATCPDDQFRNGARAVDLAERANELTKGRNTMIGVTLAAAYAEAGRFDDATRAAEAAWQLARDSGDTALAGIIETQIALYRSGQAFRDVR